MLKINRQYFFGQWLLWKTEENCPKPNFNAKSKPIPNRNLRGERGGGGGGAGRNPGGGGRKILKN